MQPSELLEHFIESMGGFLTFETFISPTLFIAFYYFGAIAIPFLAFFVVKNSVIKRIFSHMVDINEGLASTFGLASGRLKFSILFLIAFVASEVIWRVIFEFILAYFQMRDALIAIGTE